MIPYFLALGFGDFALVFEVAFVANEEDGNRLAVVPVQILTIV